MANTTPTQSIRYAEVPDVLTHTALANLADDVATQLDAADTARTHALKTPYANIDRNATLALPVTTVVTIPWDSLVTDTHGMVNLGLNPTRITVSASAGAGLYQVIVGNTSLDTTGWTRGDISFRKNGTQFVSKDFFQPINAMNFETIVSMAVADYIECHIWHEGGGTTTLFSANIRMQKVSD
jgi:hypothetical protein